MPRRRGRPSPDDALSPDSFARQQAERQRQRLRLRSKRHQQASSGQGPSLAERIAAVRQDPSLSLSTMSKRRETAKRSTPERKQDLAALVREYKVAVRQERELSSTLMSDISRTKSTISRVQHCMQSDVTRPLTPFSRDVSALTGSDVRAPTPNLELQDATRHGRNSSSGQEKATSGASFQKEQAVTLQGAETKAEGAVQLDGEHLKEDSKVPSPRSSDAPTAVRHDVATRMEVTTRGGSLMERVNTGKPAEEYQPSSKRILSNDVGEQVNKEKDAGTGKMGHDNAHLQTLEGTSSCETKSLNEGSPEKSTDNAGPVPASSSDAQKSNDVFVAMEVNSHKISRNPANDAAKEEEAGESHQNINESSNHVHYNSDGFCESSPHTQPHQMDTNTTQAVKAAAVSSHQDSEASPKRALESPQNNPSNGAPNEENGVQKNKSQRINNPSNEFQHLEQREDLVQLATGPHHRETPDEKLSVRKELTGGDSRSVKNKSPVDAPVQYALGNEEPIQMSASYQEEKHWSSAQEKNNSNGLNSAINDEVPEESEPVDTNKYIINEEDSMSEENSTRSLENIPEEEDEREDEQDELCTSGNGERQREVQGDDDITPSSSRSFADRTATKQKTSQAQNSPNKQKRRSRKYDSSSYVHSWLKSQQTAARREKSLHSEGTERLKESDGATRQRSYRWRSRAPVGKVVQLPLDLPPRRESRRTFYFLGLQSGRAYTMPVITECSVHAGRAKASDLTSALKNKTPFVRELSSAATSCKMDETRSLREEVIAEDTGSQRKAIIEVPEDPSDNAQAAVAENLEEDHPHSDVSQSPSGKHVDPLVKESQPCSPTSLGKTITSGETRGDQSSQKETDSQRNGVSDNNVEGNDCVSHEDFVHNVSAGASKIENFETENHSISTPAKSKDFNDDASKRKTKSAKKRSLSRLSAKSADSRKSPGGQDVTESLSTGKVSKNLNIDDSVRISRTSFLPSLTQSTKHDSASSKDGGDSSRSLRSDMDASYEDNGDHGRNSANSELDRLDPDGRYTTQNSSTLLGGNKVDNEQDQNLGRHSACSAGSGKREAIKLPPITPTALSPSHSVPKRPRQRNQKENLKLPPLCTPKLSADTPYLRSKTLDLRPDGNEAVRRQEGRIRDLFDNLLFFRMLRRDSGDIRVLANAESGSDLNLFLLWGQEWEDLCLPRPPDLSPNPSPSSSPCPTSSPASWLPSTPSSVRVSRWLAQAPEIRGMDWPLSPSAFHGSPKHSQANHLHSGEPSQCRLTYELIRSHPSRLLRRVNSRAPRPLRAVFIYPEAPMIISPLAERVTRREVRHFLRVRPVRSDALPPMVVAPAKKTRRQVALAELSRKLHLSHM